MGKNKLKFKHLQAITVLNRDVVNGRTKLGLNKIPDLLNHYTYEDISGKTKGCGCSLCIIRHNNFKKEQELADLKKLAKFYKKTIIKHRGEANYKSIIVKAVPKREGLNRIITIKAGQIIQTQARIDTLMSILKLPK